jgi:hypothetical protein
VSSAALSSGTGFAVTYPAALLTIAIATTAASLVARTACTASSAAGSPEQARPMGASGVQR